MASQEHYKKPKPQDLARAITGQVIDISGMQTVMEDSIVDMFDEPEYQVKLEKFLTLAMPRFMHKQDHFEELGMALMKEKHTGLEHNADDKFEAWLRATAPYAMLWNALEKVANGAKLKPEDRDALKAGPGLVGAFVANRKGAIEDMRHRETATAKVVDDAELVAKMTAKLHAAINGGKASEQDMKATPADYRAAAEDAAKLKEDMSGWDNSPQVFGKLQADLIALNKALKITERRRT